MINIHSPCATESRNRPRVPVHGEVDSLASRGIWHINGHHDRRPRRMQGRRKHFSSPVHSWTVRDKDSKGQILPHRSPREAYSGRNPTSAACRSNKCVILHDVEPDQVNNDVRLLFVRNFSGHASSRRAPDGWPTEEQLSLLSERAAGLFIHAITIIRFINQANKNRKRQLDRLPQSPEISAFEGETSSRRTRLSICPTRQFFRSSSMTTTQSTTSGPGLFSVL